MRDAPHALLCASEPVICALLLVLCTSVPVGDASRRDGDASKPARVGLDRNGSVLHPCGVVSDAAEAGLEARRSELDAAEHGSLEVKLAASTYLSGKDAISFRGERTNFPSGCADGTRA